MNLVVMDQQLRLKALGFDPGPCDGLRGPNTILAIKRAQRHYGLKPDGFVGPLTHAVLWPKDIPERDRDPVDAVPTNAPDIWPRQRDVETFFGKPGSSQIMLIPPYRMRISWDRRIKVRRFSIHKKVHDSAMEALTEIAELYDEAQRRELGLDLFGGCLNVRAMTGGKRLSMHSWGIAIDFDPARNPFHRCKIATSRLMQQDAEPFWLAWERRGWVSLGRAAGYDAMHVQAARL